MQNTGNFQVVALNEPSCPACGALTNPRWTKCLSCKSMLPVVTEPVQLDTPDEPIVATPLGKIAKSKLPPETLNAGDWRSFFEERAAILEFDGGVPREQSERLAYESCVAGVANAMPSNYRQDTYAACGTHLGASRGLPLADHAVVCNHDCHIQHMQQQRERAVEQLAQMSITARQ